MSTDLQRQHDLLAARVKHLEALLPSRAALEKEYSALRLDSASLALLNKDILSRCDAAGVWTGPISGARAAYPTVLRRTAFAMHDKLVGKRKCNAVMFTCSHVILIASGALPENSGMHASHLCHNTRCCNAAHLRWELRYVNEERNRCIGARVCLCEQEPACQPRAHAADKDP